MTNIVPPMKPVNRLPPPVFKSEHSLWLMLVDGSKTWEARRFDMADDRIYRLSWSRANAAPDSRLKSYKNVSGLRVPAIPVPGYTLVEPEVGFRDKQTHRVAFFEYKGMEFTPWAPGWCFLQLGVLLEKVPSDWSHHIAHGSGLVAWYLREKGFMDDGL